jgi:hypothetical protein
MADARASSVHGLILPNLLRLKGFALMRLFRTTADYQKLTLTNFASYF